MGSGCGVGARPQWLPQLEVQALDPEVLGVGGRGPSPAGLHGQMLGRGVETRLAPALASQGVAPSPASRPLLPGAREEADGVGAGVGARLS